MSDPLPPGADAPATPAQPSGSPSPDAEADLGLETKTFCQSDGIAPAALTRLARAIAAMGQLHQLVLCARVLPVAVRAASPAGPTRTARLSLPSELPPLLSGAFESHLLLADGVLSVWLAGLAPAGAGLEVTLLALGEETVVQASAVLGENGAPVRLRLDWPAPEPPTELALCVLADPTADTSG